MHNSTHIPADAIDSCPADPKADWIIKLDDGSVITIRPIRSEDAERERNFIENLSPETRYHRFLSGMLHPSNELLKKLTDIDHERDEAYIALIEENGHSVQIGASRYYADDDGKNCECAVIVTDAWQKRGLGTVLMLRLIKTATARHFERMYSIDTVDNADMYEFAAFHGFKRSSNPDDHTQVIHTLALK